MVSPAPKANRSSSESGNDESGKIHVSEQPPKRGFWTRIGGGALTFAIVLHGLLIVIGAVWIFQVIRIPEKTVDFLPADGREAGGGERSLQTKVQMKKQAQITPTTKVKRVFAEGAVSAYAIPEPGDDFGEMSRLSSLAGGGMSGGLGGSGNGKGFGSGSGTGLGGQGFRPVKMFGFELKDTKKVAVVMDVSRSMTKYLPIVARELDKVAERGPLILYFGCGLSAPSKKMRFDDDEAKPAKGRAFDRFWQITQGKVPVDVLRAKYDEHKFDPGANMPLPSLYKQMTEREDTYFIDFNGIFYSQPALLSKELKDADTIYWFSDFMDKVDEDEMKDLLKKLKSRRQKLFMHASVKGRFFEQVKKGLAIPSGGNAVVSEVK